MTDSSFALAINAVHRLSWIHNCVEGSVSQSDKVELLRRHLVAMFLEMGIVTGGDVSSLLKTVFKINQDSDAFLYDTQLLAILYCAVRLSKMTKSPYDHSKWIFAFSQLRKEVIRRVNENMVKAHEL